MQYDYLQALKKELEIAGAGLLTKMDQVNEENTLLKESLSTIHYQPSALRDAKKIERVKDSKTPTKTRQVIQEETPSSSDT